MMTTNSNVNASAAKDVIIITVATKTYDGGAKDTSSAEPATKRPRPMMPVRKHEDPFIYFSHHETRMRALLFQYGNDSLQNPDPVIRKTRISFELHPTLLLEDLFLENHHLGAQDGDNVDMDVIM
jgi:hypothetical protein